VKPGNGDSLGFKELGPKQTANDLLGHLRPGDKVAVVSRFSNKAAQSYVTALVDRGLQVRLVQGQTSEQDFCFLLRAQKELVGVSISTFFYWAACLSNASRIISYSLDIPAHWRRRGRVFFHYNYTHPELSGRWLFRLFKPTDSENPINSTEKVGLMLLARG
jgi:hypothetical protein